MPLTRGPGQAGRPVRRHLPPDRLRAVQPGQRRLSADRGADAVQVALARPAHLADLADVDAARQLRHAGAGPAAARPAVVPGQRRRDLPVDEPDQRRRARTTSWSSAPTTSTGWTPRRWSHAHIDARRRRHRRRHPGAAQARPSAVRRDQDRRGRRTRSTSSWRSRPTRRACRTRPTSRSPRWATTSSRADVAGRGAGEGRRQPGLAARHGRRHHPDARRAEARPASTTSSATIVPGATDARPRLLARRRDARLLPRGAPGPGLGRAGLQPLQHRLADLHLAPAAAGREVRRGRVRPRHDRLRRLDRVRRRRGQLGDRHQRDVVSAAPRSSAASSSTTSRSAADAVSATRSWTRTSSCPTASRSVSTRISTGSGGSSSPRVG